MQKMAVFSKANIMIIFLQKLAVVITKTGNIFAKFLGENILKIITSVPDWANFCPMDDFRQVFLKLPTYVAHNFGYFFPR
jgi:hypothetical protein